MLVVINKVVLYCGYVSSDTECLRLCESAGPAERPMREITLCAQRTTDNRESLVLVLFYCGGGWWGRAYGKGRRDCRLLLYAAVHTNEKEKEH